MRHFVAHCYFGADASDAATTATQGGAKLRPPRRGKYLYLITSSITRNGKSKTVSHVGTSTRPATRIKQHNGLLPKGQPTPLMFFMFDWAVQGPKATRNTDHPWQFALICGPYLKYATALRRCWSKKNRGTHSRIAYGLRIANVTQKQAFIDEAQII